MQCSHWQKMLHNENTFDSSCYKHEIVFVFKCCYSLPPPGSQAQCQQQAAEELASEPFTQEGGHREPHAS